MKEELEINMYERYEPMWMKKRNARSKKKERKLKTSALSMKPKVYLNLNQFMIEKLYVITLKIFSG